MIQLLRVSLSSDAVVVMTPVVESISKLLPATPFGMLYVSCTFIAEHSKQWQSMEYLTKETSTGPSSSCIEC